MLKDKTEEPPAAWPLSSPVAPIKASYSNYLNYFQSLGRGVRNGELNIFASGRRHGKSSLIHNIKTFINYKYGRLADKDTEMTILWNEQPHPGRWTRLASHVGLNHAEAYAVRRWLTTNIGPRRGRWAVIKGTVWFAHPQDAIYFKMVFNDFRIRDVVGDDIMTNGWNLQYEFEFNHSSGWRKSIRNFKIV